MRHSAYVLWHDASHAEDSTYEANLTPFEGSEQICGWIEPEPRRVPNPILFEADLEAAKYSDYPSNDVHWPIISPRMLEILQSVGDFPHRLIPVQLVDRRVPGPARYLADGSLRPAVIDARFAAVQITDHLDAVDWDRSLFEQSRLGRATLYDFDKLVLKEPRSGFPPLFRIAVQASLLLVSAEARRALEAAGIRGARFEPLPGA